MITLGERLPSIAASGSATRHDRHIAASLGPISGFQRPYNQRLSPGSRPTILARLLVVVFSAVVGGGFGLVAATLTPKTYSCRAFLLVLPASVRPPDVTSVSFAQAVARVSVDASLLPSSPPGAASVPARDVIASMRASASPDAPLVEIVAQARSATRAEQLVDLVSVSVSARLNSETAASGFRVLQATKPVRPLSPTSPNRLVDAVVGAGLGALLTFGALVLRVRRTLTDHAMGEPAGAPVDPPARISQ